MNVELLTYIILIFWVVVGVEVFYIFIGESPRIDFSPAPKFLLLSIICLWFAIFWPIVLICWTVEAIQKGIRNRAK